MIPLLWYLLITPIGFLLIVAYRFFLHAIKYDSQKTNTIFHKQLKLLIIIWGVIGLWVLVWSYFGTCC
ncbi:hypothetical protein KY348_07385 [Candidatus Woesearchaeota archaeon]|nr:hypothetical protein [Candidatus Woesearchaeota archaeon]